jgi:hypothetical protein
MPSCQPGRPGKPGWHTPPNHPPPLPWGGPNPYMCFVRGPCQTGPPLEGVQTTLPGTDPKPGGVGNPGFQGLEFQVRNGHPKSGSRPRLWGVRFGPGIRDPGNLGSRPPQTAPTFRTLKSSPQLRPDLGFRPNTLIEVGVQSRSRLWTPSSMRSWFCQ